MLNGVFMNEFADENMCAPCDGEEWPPKQLEEMEVTLDSGAAVNMMPRNKCTMYPIKH